MCYGCGVAVWIYIYATLSNLEYVYYTISVHETGIVTAESCKLGITHGSNLVQVVSRIVWPNSICRYNHLLWTVRAERDVSYVSLSRVIDRGMYLRFTLDW